MELHEIAECLLSYPEVTEETPFGPDVLVYKVAGKMFATLSEEDSVGRSNLKCDPDKALNLRDAYPSIIPGYHMNKKHWNTVLLDGSIPEALLREMVADSWRLVVSGHKKADRERLLEKHAKRDA